MKISIIDICYANTAPIPKNEKFNKNAKVEKLTKKLGRSVRLIVKGPLFVISFISHSQFKL